MATIEEIRHTNLLLLIMQLGSIAAVARGAGRSHSQISQIKTKSLHSTTGKPRVMDKGLARDIERQLKKPDGWMDTPRPDIWREHGIPIPIMGDWVNLAITAAESNGNNPPLVNWGGG